MSIEVYFILAIIGFCSFFVWNWLFKKLIKVPNRVKIATWVATILTTPLIYVAMVLLFIFILSYYPEKDFNSTKWKNDPENRFELSKDLIDSNLLIGKTKIQVEQLLGKTTNFNDNYWSYDLGFVPSLGNIDPDILEITFENGKAIKVTQRNT